MQPTDYPGRAVPILARRFEHASDDNIERVTRIAFTDDHSFGQDFAQTSRLSQLALDRRFEPAQQRYPTQHARQVDVPNDLPMRGLEQRDIALRIGWRKPSLIEKPQGRDHDLPGNRKLVGIIADPEIEAIDDAAVVAFVDEHDRSRILANSLRCHHCSVQDRNGALAASICSKNVLFNLVNLKTKSTGDGYPCRRG